MCSINVVHNTHRSRMYWTAIWHFGLCMYVKWPKILNSSDSQNTKTQNTLVSSTYCVSRSSPNFITHLSENRFHRSAQCRQRISSSKILSPTLLSAISPSKLSDKYLCCPRGHRTFLDYTHILSHAAIVTPTSAAIKILTVVV